MNSANIKFGGLRLEHVVRVYDSDGNRVCVMRKQIDKPHWLLFGTGGRYRIKHRAIVLAESVEESKRLIMQLVDKGVIYEEI